MSIEIKDIRKSFGHLQVLKGIDLTIQKNEIISILGASGAGKTTLLHIMGTLDKPDSGQILYDGIDVFSLGERKLNNFRNKHIGFVFQFHHLLPEFTALENVCIPAYIGGMNKNVAAEKAEKLLITLGLQDRMTHKPSALSGGEQQRVAVARALINDPDVILADEPSGNLDSDHARELHELFLKLRNEMNQTFVIITHNPDLAQLSDRQIHMRDGYLVQ
ncbi:MAG: lipoprotein ABC transporter ATP-binding protein [Bacteroidetes bacterium GWF2_43_63]|nr:MAG: lipoprotein ABC transporter ATP-binding protein [Bacteroidetes bacterium GWE2_42_42]OFY56471.1 MAG: lipoprotein ABC transporter ATP-binding protein [Bacteroidetes bacterium GWF2_43_63]HBG71183.1 lipoprotein-releasing system ATP-binding protein LolD [Bacteroidales bacterium]HCB61266.1 lipoprotein-releasing system ATP-binding protein LolD [Bacteroidales bacterium]HCY23283.1 lipoprotein-releasing system ATP-binding protein LolD [Bacteroidales bacterium]